jgi:hypothetical protein
VRLDFNEETILIPQVYQTGIEPSVLEQETILIRAGV